LAAIVFDRLGFSVTFRPQQLFLISSIIRNGFSNPLEGSAIRGSRKGEILGTKKKGQDCGE